jgi:membrane-associated phospholipid phosphatase
MVKLYVCRKLLLLSVFCTQILFSQNPDIRILRALNSPEKLPSDNMFRFISNSNAWIVVIIPATMGTTGLLNHDKALFRNAEVVAAASLVNAGITAAMKYSINRTRPFITYPDIAKKSGAASPSFPSGHTSSAFATATSVSLAYPKWYIIAPMFSWAGAVGYSRMDLGVHYPSDVLAGAVIGAGSAWLTHYVNKKLIQRSRQ